jgi:hypothetical protein
MENSKSLKIILFVSGLFLVAIGGAILFAPIAFTARNGIELGENISLLNDTRAAGAALFVGGFVILLGDFIQKLSYTSLIVSIISYLGYAFGRIISVVFDGMPAEGLIKATVVEVIIGLVSVFALYKFKNKK